MSDLKQVFYIEVSKGRIDEKELRNAIDQLFVIGNDNIEIGVSCEYDTDWKDI